MPSRLPSARTALGQSTIQAGQTSVKMPPGGKRSMRVVSMSYTQPLSQWSGQSPSRRGSRSRRPDPQPGAPPGSGRPAPEQHGRPPVPRPPGQRRHDGPALHSQRQQEGHGVGVHHRVAMLRCSGGQDQPVRRDTLPEVHPTGVVDEASSDGALASPAPQADLDPCRRHRSPIRGSCCVGHRLYVHEA